MNLNLENKVAIVTGASAGLGKAIALSLANEGVKIAISARNQNALKQTATEIKSATKRGVLAVSGDMSMADSVKDHFFVLLTYKLHNKSLARRSVNITF